MRTKKNETIVKVILTAITLIMGLCCIYPFIFMISSSFKPSGDVLSTPLQIIPKNFTLTNFETLFHNEFYDFFKWFGNTVVMTGLTLILKFFIITITAYGFAKIKFPGRDAIFLVLLAGLMIPSDIMIMPRYIIFKQLHILNTMWALILPAAVDVYFVFLLRQAFVAVPDALSEAARIDGCSHFTIYRRIILPLCMPQVSTMLLFSFVWSWNDFMGLLRGANGLFQAMIWPPIVRLFAESMPLMRQKRACVSINSTTPAGTLAAYALSAALLQFADWHHVFFSCGGLLLGMAAVFWLGTAPLRRATTYAPQPELQKQKGTGNGPAALLAAELGAMLLPVLLHGGLKDGVTNWVPSMIQSNFGISPAFSAAVAMALPLVNLSGAYLSGWLNEHCGSLGGGHGHADLLHLDVWHHGEAVLADAGRYTYVEGAERAWFKSPAAHNTFRVDETDFTRYRATWEWAEIARPLPTETRFTPQADLLRAGHLGHAAQGITAEREIVFIKPDLLIGIDRIFAPEGTRHTVEQFFHFGSGTLEQEGASVLWQGKQTCAQLHWLAGQFAARSALPAAPLYNLKIKTPVLGLKCHTESTASLPFVLCLGGTCTVELLPVTDGNGRPLASDAVQAVRITRNGQSIT